jgi:hypothetical protein
MPASVSLEDLIFFFFFNKHPGFLYGTCKNIQFCIFSFRVPIWLAGPEACMCTGMGRPGSAPRQRGWGKGNARPGGDWVRLVGTGTGLACLCLFG